MSAVKDEARKLIDSMPDHATWDDVMYEFYIKKKLEQSLKEAAEGDVISHRDVKKYLFPK